MRYDNESLHFWNDDQIFAARVKLELDWLDAMEGMRIVGSPPTISDGELTELLNEARAIEVTTRHDVASMVEAMELWLEKVGYQHSRFVHFGLTSSDIVDTILSNCYKRSFEVVGWHFRQLMGLLERIPQETKLSKVVARTHGVPAGELYFGMRIAGWYQELGDCFRGINSLKFYGKMSGPYGLANGFKDQKVCEQIVLGRFGLDSHDGSTQVIPRHVYANYHFQMAQLARVLGRIATSIRVAITAGDLYHEPVQGEIGSSSMPHKVNPWKLERIAGIARVLDSHLMAAMANIDLWLERDISHSVVERLNPKTGFELLIRAICDLMSEIPRLRASERSSFPDSYHRLNQAILGGLSRAEAHKQLR